VHGSCIEQCFQFDWVIVDDGAESPCVFTKKVLWEMAASIVLAIIADMCVGEVGFVLTMILFETLVISASFYGLYTLNPQTL